jgi:chemotaxis protein methyltransferase CheR
MPHLERFQELVAQHAGLHMRQQERDVFLKALDARMQALKLVRPEDYLRLLEGSDAASLTEWKRLLARLTNNESYFYRDRGQLALLEEQVLPELIERNRAHRTLRVWSAGCSTGEEAYSLAMIIDQILPLREGWDIYILGTDLSETALEKARRGVYGAWSFRTIDSDTQRRYFKQQGNSFEFDAKLRRTVTFRTGNLLQDPFPSRASGICDMDLILCRNVFIYFKRDAIARVLGKFTETLRDGGFLMTGHAELHDVPLTGLRTLSYPQTVIYQRGTQHSPTRVATNHGHLPGHRQTPVTPLYARPVSPPSPVATRPAPSSSGVTTTSRHTLRTTPAQSRSTLHLPAAGNGVAKSQHSPAPGGVTSARSAEPPQHSTDKEEFAALLREAETLLGAGAARAALRPLNELVRRHPTDYTVLCLAAEAHANLGEHETALEYSRRAVAIEPLSARTYQIMARIAEERDDRDAAKEMLKKAIYLAPSMVGPYVELSAIYAREGDRPRARKMRQAALSVLETLPPDAALPQQHSGGRRQRQRAPDDRVFAPRRRRLKAAPGPQRTIRRVSSPLTSGKHLHHERRYTTGAGT